MRKVKIWFITFFLSISFNVLFSQSIKYQFSIFDKNTKKGLEDVFITPLNNTEITASLFSITDAAGFCMIEAPVKIDSFYISRLGYNDAVVLGSEKNIVYLTQRENVLKEVIINDVAIKENLNKDTIHLNVGQYRDGTEKKIEELIKKIPEVEVDDNRVIRYRGDIVYHVLIENDDLLGHNYTVGTKNLSAEIVKEVSIYRNYSNDPVRGSIVKSDITAMNIKLEDRFISTFTANINFGLGGSKEEVKHDNNGVLLGILKKFKSFTFLGVNNVRNDLIGNAKFYNQNEGYFPSSLMEHIGQSDVMIDNISEKQVASGPKKLGSANNILNLSENWTLRVNGIASAVSTIINEENSIDFLGNPSPVVFIDSIKTQNISKLFELNAQLKYIHPNKTMSIFHDFQWASQPVRHQYNVNRNGLNQNLSFLMRNMDQLFQSRVTISKSWNKNILYSFQFYSGINQIEDQNDYNSNVLANYLSFDNNSNSFSQIDKSKTFRLKIDHRFDYVKKNLFTLKFGAQIQKLNSNLSQQIENRNIQNLTNGIGEIWDNDYYFSSSYDIRNKFFKLNLSSIIGHRKVSSIDQGISYFNPNLNIYVSLPSRWIWKLNAKRHQSFENIRWLLGQSFVSSYASIQENTNELALNDKFELSSSFSKMAIDKTYSFLLQGFYQKNLKEWFSNPYYDAGVSLIRFSYGGPNSMKSIGAKGNYTIRKLMLIVEQEFSLRELNSLVLLDEIRNIKNNILDSKTGIKSGFSKFNFELSFQYINSNSIIANSENVLFYQTNTSLSLRFTQKNLWKFEHKIRYGIQKSSDQVGTAIVSDFELTVYPKKIKRISYIQLTGINPWDVSKFESVFANAFYKSVRSNYLVEPFFTFVIGVDFN